MTDAEWRLTRLAREQVKASSPFTFRVSRVFADKPPTADEGVWFWSAALSCNVFLPFVVEPLERR